MDINDIDTITDAGALRATPTEPASISIRKNPCFTVYMTASPAESPSVTSGLRVSFQPTKPALPIRFLCVELPKVYVFSAHKIFTTFSAPFLNRICHFKILAGP